MINTKQAKKRIKTAKNIAKITKAMELVAASKMKRAQIAAQASRPYAQKLYQLTAGLAKDTKVSTHSLLRTPETSGNNRLIVLIAPEKGLCGALVSNLYREFLTEKANINPNTRVITIGKKAREIGLKYGLEILAEFETGFNQPEFEIVPPICRLITEEYQKGQTDSVAAVYTKFINTMNQQAITQKLLPMVFTAEAETKPEATESEAPVEFLFEPRATKLLPSLLPHCLETQIFQILLEAFASEQSARMMAMKNATDNAHDIIAELTLKYNRARQAKITAEIADITTAGLVIEQ